MVYFEITEFYKKITETYLKRFRLVKRDFSNNIPNKQVIRFPKSGNECILGYTYRGDKVWIRDDIPENSELYARVKWFHENPHTNWEYETRLREELFAEQVFGKKRKKYEKNPPDYQQ